VEVHLLSPAERIVPLTKEDERGYWSAVVDDVWPGALYRFRLDGEQERPDPASQSQPDGVHGPSQVVDTNFDWNDTNWQGVPLDQHVFYELHVGTFTQEGTFDAIIPHLTALRELGVTSIELMPVAQFPGVRNWGYDGVYPYAVQNSYGGATGLKRLVNAAHQQGLAVVLDVVYNHLGPEGNYLGDFAPYFTDCYKTPWGQAVNFDGPESDEVRRFFIDNACWWIEEFHVDGLRMDATHFIFDTSANPVLREFAEAIHGVGARLRRHVHLFPESDNNDVRWLQPAERGGFALDAQWNDDFQHAVFTMLPGAEAGAYKQDYGRFDQLVKAYEVGYVYTGEYSPYRKRRHGNDSSQEHGSKFVVFVQNHDQVGNRPRGDRICTQTDLEATKLGAAAMILSPYLPLIFMGEEHGEPRPFLYFVDHGDPQLIEAVREGRKEEFGHFMEGEEPPDPQSRETMEKCCIQHELREHGDHKALWEWHRELLRLRRELPPLAELDRKYQLVHAFEEERVLAIERTTADNDQRVLVVLGFNEDAVSLRVPEGRWSKVLDSGDSGWGGAGESLPAELGGGDLLELPRCCAAVYAMSGAS